MISIDDPSVSRFVFHPRPEMPGATPGAVATETVCENASVCGWVHPNGQSDTLLLFFHGNGEIAADYGALAHLYTGCGVSFWVVDYRGYGRSTGTPSFSRMLSDADAVLGDVPTVEAETGIRFSRIVVMGRSLGSAPAIYLAAAHPDRVDGLILDSPFSDGPALIRRLGGPEVDLERTPGFRDNGDRMRDCRLPTLILHGIQDWIIPVSDAETLRRVCPSSEKRLVVIEGAGHNDLLIRGMNTYLSSIRALLEAIRRGNA
jgi:pimeloyl-ACP methyl ester carboxylesterase